MHAEDTAQDATNWIQCDALASRTDFEMEKSRARPIITITTYTSSNPQHLKQTVPEGLERSQRADEPQHATSSDSSTNFFRDTKRAGRPLQYQSYSASCRDASRTDLSQIKGPTGSVRGHKDVVRRSLEGIKITYRNRYSKLSSSSGALSSSSLLSFSNLFASQLAMKDESPPVGSNQTPSGSYSLLKLSNEMFCSEYLAQLVEEEQNLCVVYTTTLGVIRRTFEDSKIVKSILNLNLVRYEERDIYLNQEYKFQLRMRTGGSISVPALYVDGKYIGGTLELETMNESGQLQTLFAKFKMSKAKSEICACCGNARFIACQSCNGSRRSTIHHFKFNSVALRCIKCDKNDGLVQCPACTNGGIQGSQSNVGDLSTVITEELDEMDEEVRVGADKIVADINNN